MNQMDYIFFEEFKTLDNLCRDIYGTTQGVTGYINDMERVPWGNSHFVTNWETDLKRLRELRHLRNHLAHTSGSFDDEYCTQEDIEWVRSFYKRILNQTDPMALLRKILKSERQNPRQRNQISRASVQMNETVNRVPEKTKTSGCLLGIIVVLAVALICGAVIVKNFI